MTERDLTVWIISGLLALGVGWSRFAKWKTRERLVREFVAMDPAQRAKVLNRMDPKLAMEIREQLLARYQILT